MKSFRDILNEANGDEISTKYIGNKVLTIPEQLPNARSNFRIHSSGILKSLKNVPKKVFGDFSIWGLKSLKSLEYSPELVKGTYTASDCKLTSFDGLTDVKIGGYLFFSENPIKNLQGMPLNVGKGYMFDYCQLTSLKGAPKVIDGIFNITHNNLTNLDYAPKKVTGYFKVIENPLKNIDGIKNGEYANLILPKEILETNGGWIKDAAELKRNYNIKCDEIEFK